MRRRIDAWTCRLSNNQRQCTFALKCSQAQAERNPFPPTAYRMRVADLILVIMGYTNRRRPLKLAEERHGVDGWMSSTSPNPLAASQCCEGSQTITTNFSSSRGYAQASQRISNGSGARVPGLQMLVIHDALTNGESGQRSAAA